MDLTYISLFLYVLHVKIASIISLINRKVINSLILKLFETVYFRDSRATPCFSGVEWESRYFTH